MPLYKVNSPGFYAGKKYDPEGKRKVLDVEKAFTKKTMPSWVSEMPDESDSVKAKRKKQAVSQKAADVEKANQDKKDVEGASFMDDGKSSKVETI